MSDTSSVTPQPIVPSPTAAINAPGATAAKPTANASTPVTSMEDLREKAPKMYDAIMQGIAMTICRQSRRHADRLKKLMKEDRRNQASA